MDFGLYQGFLYMGLTIMWKCARYCNSETFWASAQTLNFGSWEFEEDSPAKHFHRFPVFLKTTWLLCFGRTLGGEAVVAAPLLLVLHLQLVHHLLVQKTLVPTLALVVEEPCQAEEIWTRMLDSRVLGMEGDAGTDLGLKKECSLFSWPIIGSHLGDSISGTCKKLELFFPWTEGEWRVGAGRARSSATGTCKIFF